MKTSYGERDYKFGQTMLTLRTAVTNGIKCFFWKFSQMRHPINGAAGELVYQAQNGMIFTWKHERNFGIRQHVISLEKISAKDRENRA